MSSKRNVLLLIASFDKGGAESQIVQLTRLLLGSDHYRVHLACHQRRGALLEEAEALGLGEIPEFPLDSFYDRNMAIQLRRFAALLRERKIDVVHTEGFYTNVFGMAGGALGGVPARIAFRGEVGGIRTEKQKMVERWAYRVAHAVHANSDAVRRQLIEEGVNAKKILTVYNGLDMKRVMPQPGLRRDQMLDLLNLPKDKSRCFVTIVANMRHDVKDQRMFLRAARRVRAEAPEAAFVLAGEGELLEPLRAFAAELGLKQDVFFTGRCDHVAELLAVSDVCALTSKAEGFSNSILEYMAAARPVVATDVGGAREAIIESETGYLVRSGDDETMARRIVSLLRDPTRAREMGERARRVVEEKFSAQAQLENTQKMYDQVLAWGRKQIAVS